MRFIFPFQLPYLTPINVMFIRSYTMDSFYHFPFQNIDTLATYISQYLTELEQLELR